MSDKKYPEVEGEMSAAGRGPSISVWLLFCYWNNKPGVADDDGEAGRQKCEHEEKLLGWPAVLVQDDGAGPHREVQPELAPGGERCWHQEYKPEYPGGGNV